MQGACYFALRQNGEGLELHRDPAPAEQKRGQRQAFGTGAEPLHGGGAAAELKKAREHGAHEARLKAKARGDHPAEKRERPTPVQHREQHRKAQGEAAHAQHRRDCLPHRFREGEGGIHALQENGYDRRDLPWSTE